MSQSNFCSKRNYEDECNEDHHCCDYCYSIIESRRDLEICRYLCVHCFKKESFFGDIKVNKKTQNLLNNSEYNCESCGLNSRDAECDTFCDTCGLTVCKNCDSFCIDCGNYVCKKCSPTNFSTNSRCNECDYRNGRILLLSARLSPNSPFSENNLCIELFLNIFEYFFTKKKKSL